MSTWRRTLRTVLLALAFAFAVGFGIGSWLRCRMERPPTYIGGMETGLRQSPSAAFLDAAP